MTLREWMNRHELTQTDVAHRLGVTRVTVHKWYHGTRPRRAHRAAIDALTAPARIDWPPPGTTRPLPAAARLWALQDKGVPVDAPPRLVALRDLLPAFKKEPPK